MLNDIQIKNAKPDEKAYRIADEQGLYLDVRPSGKKVWRVRYWYQGKENTLTLGVYPAVSLRDARLKRDEARLMLDAGNDPSIARQSARASETPTFETISREWLEKKAGESKSEKTRQGITARLEQHILPFIGNLFPDEITAPKLLAIARRLEERGVIETAHRVLNICSQIFRYAIATGRAERDPSADLRGALASTKGGHHASITDPKKIGALLRSIDAYDGTNVVRCAMQILALTFVRSIELRGAEWPEFSFDEAIWRIPDARMKMKRPHIVPLSAQTISILQELRNDTGHGRYVFPNGYGRSGSRPMSENAVRAALRRMGYTNDEMTGHGFRHMASTRLNESGLWNVDAIERQLAHSQGNSVRAVYNYAEYMPERQRMMQWWADYLDELKAVRPSGNP